MVVIFKKLMAVFSRGGSVAQYSPLDNTPFIPYANGSRSIWDVIGERRMEEQRLAELNKPKGNWGTDYMALENAFVWLPAIQLKTPLPIEDLATLKTDVEHDVRLFEGAGLRRNVRRIPDADMAPAEVDALPRALQLLQLVFAQWEDFAPEVDWLNTEVVLFVPNGLSPQQWENEVVSAWPWESLPRTINVATDFAEWLPRTLESSTGAEHVLCISVDSWATRSAISHVSAEQPAGESVALLNLRRVSKISTLPLSSEIALFPAISREHCSKSQQKHKSVEDFGSLVQGLCEQSSIAIERIHGVITEGLESNNRRRQLYEYLKVHLPQCDPQDHVVDVMPMRGHTGRSAAQMTSLALAFLTVQAKPEGAMLVVDRVSEFSTQGWLIAWGQHVATDLAS